MENWRTTATAALVVAWLAGCGDIQPVPSESLPLNHPPQVSLIGPQFVVEGDSIQVEAIALDGDEDPLVFLWGSTESSDRFSAPTARKTQLSVGVAGLRRLWVEVADGDTTVGADLQVHAEGAPLPPGPEYEPKLAMVYDAATIDDIGVNHPWMSGFPEPGDAAPAPVSIAGVKVAENHWRFDLGGINGHPRFRPHSFSYDPAAPDAAGWAIIDSTMQLPMDALFDVATYADAGYFQWLPSLELECPEATFQLAVLVAAPNRTVVSVPGVGDDTEFLLYCFGEPGEELPWSPILASTQAEVVRWQHNGALDARYTRWNIQRVDNGQLGCALEGSPGVVCSEPEDCSFRRYF